MHVKDSEFNKALRKQWDAYDQREETCPVTGPSGGYVGEFVGSFDNWIKARGSTWWRAS